VRSVNRFIVLIVFLVVGAVHAQQPRQLPPAGGVQVAVPRGSDADERRDEAEQQRVAAERGKLANRPIPRTADGHVIIGQTLKEKGVWLPGPVIPNPLGFTDIPYQPWAAEKKKQNAENWLTLDPEIKCYMPGVPRATYEPHPFQIVQSRDTVLISYEFASASRIVRMTNPGEAPLDSWMGWSRGHWEGDTLVVDVTGLNDQTWFDRAGNFHSDALHVIERYTRSGPDHLSYEATIEDPKVFTRPWKISMPLYRRQEKNAQLLEYKCVEFVEELMYGELRKKPTQPAPPKEQKE